MSAARASRSLGAGFTLIEMLASILLTSIVITVAVNFYINLSRATETATLRLRHSRNAATIVDRIARDLEATLLLVKPEEMDPLEHPWIFLAEASAFGEGADRVKFVARNVRAHSTSDNPYGLSVVSYVLAESGGFSESYDLYRFSSPRLPDGLDRDFPDLDDPAARLIARDLASFSLRFMTDTGDWVDSWDSSTLIGSGELPTQVEINVALRDESGESPKDEFLDDEAPTARNYVRRVALQMRPIDLEAEFAEWMDLSTKGSGEGGCITVTECLQKPQNQGLWEGYFERCSVPNPPPFCDTADECYTPQLMPGAIGCGE